MDSAYYSFDSRNPLPQQQPMAVNTPSANTVVNTTEYNYNHGYNIDAQNPSYTQPVYTSSYHMPYYEYDGTQQQNPPQPQAQTQAQYQPPLPPQQQPQAQHPARQLPPNFQEIQQRSRPTGYIDPYSQLPRQDLDYNEYDSYVRPLDQKELINNSRRHISSQQGSGYNESGYTARRSPVEVSGLVPIPTSRVDEPTKDANLVKHEREAEERSFILPQVQPGALDTIKVGRKKGPSAKKIQRRRNGDLQGITFDGPEPEQINCGWSEYQGGASWEDINRYRTHELQTLKQTQKRQAETGEAFYYY
jgi:hypothetical protein